MFSSNTLHHPTRRSRAPKPLTLICNLHSTLQSAAKAVLWTLSHGRHLRIQNPLNRQHRDIHHPTALFTNLVHRGNVPASSKDNVYVVNCNSRQVSDQTQEHYLGGECNAALHGFTD